MKDLFLFAMITLIIASCSPSDQIQFTMEPEVTGNPNDAVPLSALLNFKTENLYQDVIIHLKNSHEQFQLSYNFSDKKPNGFPLVFLKPETHYYISFMLTDEEGKKFSYHDTLQYITPPLPADPREFPEITVTKNGSDIASGFTLMNPRRRIPLDDENAKEFNQNFGMLLVVDNNGEVVWYYKTDSRISDFDILPSGDISYMTQDSRLVVIDLLGNIINTWYASNRPDGGKISDTAVPVEALTFHHDATLLPNGNWVVLSSEYRKIENYYTSYEKGAPGKTQEVMGDIIKEFTPEGKLVWEWYTFDHLDPFRIGYETFSGYWERRGFPGVIDWSHANAILYDRNDDSFIINFRYLSALMKIDRNTKEIKWIFGEPSGWDDSLQEKLIQLDENSKWFWHQHSPHITNDRRILLFNNDNYHARPFDNPVDIQKTQSQVMEFTIDEQKLTAQQVWSSKTGDKENIVSIAMGDVDYLENGNILAGYGALISKNQFNEATWWNRTRIPQWTMIREFRHSTPATIVWELQLNSLDEESGVGWTIFGAERFKPENLKF